MQTNGQLPRVPVVQAFRTISDGGLFRGLEGEPDTWLKTDQ